MKQRWKETKKKEYSKAAKSNQFPRFEDKHLTLLPAIGCPTLALQTEFYLLVFCKRSFMLEYDLYESFLQSSPSLQIFRYIQAFLRSLLMKFT